MRHRGAVFWGWTDPPLQHHSNTEQFADGARLDIQARLYRTGDTQLFMGSMNAQARPGLRRLTPSGPARRLHGQWRGELAEDAHLLKWEHGRRRSKWLSVLEEAEHHGKPNCRAGRVP